MLGIYVEGFALRELFTSRYLKESYVCLMDYDLAVKRLVAKHYMNFIYPLQITWRKKRGLTCSWCIDPSGATAESLIRPSELSKSNWWMASRIPSLHFNICFSALWSSFSGLIFSRLEGKSHIHVSSMQHMPVRNIWDKKKTSPM